MVILRLRYFLLIFGLTTCSLIIKPNENIAEDNLAQEIQNSTDVSNPSKDETIYINIFIHGTTRPYLSLNNIMAIWRQNGVEQSPYATMTKFMRSQNLSHKYQAIQGLGLQPINLKEDSTSGAVAIANVFDFFLKLSYPNQKNKYFTFGWSGILATKSRKIAAKKLLRAINRLIREAKIKKKKVYIRLITYSHGATFPLNMVKYNKSNIVINELIALGMPVQYDTDYLINSDMFQNIYHFYSMSDYVQSLDHLSSKYFACHRRFSPRKGFTLPKKLRQINVEVTRTFLSQYECKNKSEGLKSNNKKIFKKHNLNPGHSELWGLGWTPNTFRNEFPLYPLPIVAIVPLLISKIQEVEKHCDKSNDFTVNIDPILNTLRVTQIFIKRKLHYTFEFVDKKILDQIKADVCKKFMPKESLTEEYNKIVKESVKFANRKHNLCDLFMCKIEN